MWHYCKPEWVCKKEKKDKYRKPRAQRNCISGHDLFPSRIHQANTRNPTEHFRLWEPLNPRINEINLVQKHLLTAFEAPKFLDVQSGTEVQTRDDFKFKILSAYFEGGKRFDSTDCILRQSVCLFVRLLVCPAQKTRCRAFFQMKKKKKYRNRIRSVNFLCHSFRFDFSISNIVLKMLLSNKCQSKSFICRVKFTAVGNYL